jgi:uncharacterized protein YcaQ
VTSPTRTIDIPTARRFLARRHLLAPPRSLPPGPESVMKVVERLGSLQFDPLEVAGRNHDLVLAARVAGYQREITDRLLYVRRLLYETYNKSLNLVPTGELPYYRISWDRSLSGWGAQILEEQAPLVSKVLAEIEAEGPRSSADFEREAAIAWQWGPTSAVRAVLEALAMCGRLGLARRDGNKRYYDLTERLFPAELLAERRTERDQLRHKLLSRYRAHGLLGASGGAELWIGIKPTPLRGEIRAELVDRGELVPVTVEGMRGQRFVVAGELGLLTEAEDEVSAPVPAAAGGRVAAGSRTAPGPAAGVSFIAPLDPLMWDRDALVPLYSFEYRWEVYTPAARRRWGYYVLPILFGDRLVGRIEPRLDRTAGRVRILSLGWEAGFDPLAEPGFPAAFGEALSAYLAFGGADAVERPTAARHRALFRELTDSVRLMPARRRASAPRRASGPRSESAAGAAPTRLAAEP